MDAVTIESLSRMLEEARAARDDYLYVPVIVPDAPPGAAEMAPFLGEWTGTVFTDPGTDLGIRASIRRDGEGWVVEALLTGPGGGTFETRSSVVRVRPDGALEWARPARGTGQIVTIARLDDSGALVGTDEARGIRVPRTGMPVTTVRLTRARGPVPPTP